MGTEIQAKQSTTLKAFTVRLKQILYVKGGLPEAPLVGVSNVILPTVCYSMDEFTLPPHTEDGVWQPEREPFGSVFR